MSKMSELDMMVSEAVEYVESNGEYTVAEAVTLVAEDWALDSEEFTVLYNAVYEKTLP